MSGRHAIFLINLLQDVNVVRPLVFMASRDLGLHTAFFVSRQFIERDKQSLWQKELGEIGDATSTPLLVFDDALQALQLLQEKQGVLIAASESDVPAHAPVHDVMRFAPGSFVKITLQHGFECVGFLHNRAHDQAYGEDVTFAADVVCGWASAAQLTSLAPSQRSKLFVSGPPAVLHAQRAGDGRVRDGTGIVCENLHSVRLNMPGDFKADFIGMFNGFCAALAAEGRNVALRPHPGGQYLLKNNVALPPNAVLNNHPIYKVDLGKYAYGVSAPSSVLIDMALAGIPVAVWRDAGGAMDARNYEGLTEISTPTDWLDFSREATAHPGRFIARQQRFLEQRGIPVGAEEVYRRFARLLGGAARHAVDGTTGAAGAREMKRVLFVANALDPTLQLCLLKPLAPLIDAGEIATELVTERQMKEEFGDRMRDRSVRGWLDKRFAMFRPTLLVFCRYGGPHGEYMLQRARREGIPAIYHIDDDLLNVPEQIGVRKQKHHGHPLRLAAVRHLLDNADLIYCSTKPLENQFRGLGVKAPLLSRTISCSGRVIVPPVERPARRIGYMGYDKAYDLEMILAPLVGFLRRNTEIEFQLFGSFTKPEPLEEFGDRITLLPPVPNYDDFLNELARLNWDIGICPLAPTAFNMLKANNKWIEYTSVGTAVIASRGTVYDACCADGCGILVTTADEWVAALEELTQDPAARFAQVRRAQKKLAEEYSTERLRAQVLEVFGQAKSGSSRPSNARAS